MRDNSDVNDQTAMLERIRSSMKERGLTQGELAASIGLTSPIMSRALNGGRQLSAAELGRLADRLGVSAGFLLSGEVTAPSAFAIAARVGDAGAASVEESPEMAPVFSRARSLLELRGLFSRLVADTHDGGVVDVEAYTNWSFVKAGAETARRVRAATGLGEEPIEDLGRFVAKHFALDASSEPLDADLHGVLLSTGRRSPSVALIDSSDSIGRQRFTLAHELGHLIFGDADVFWADRRKAGKSVEEKRADVFAVALLLPEGGVASLLAQVAEEHDGDPDAVTQVGRVAAHFATSIDATAWRLLNLKYISEDDCAVVRSLPAALVAERAGVADVWEQLESQQGDVAPPPDLMDRALFAYAEAMVGLDPLMSLFCVDDAEALRADLAEQGWAPQYSW